MNKKIGISRKLIAIPAILASIEEAITTIPTTTRAIATTIALLTATTTSASGHSNIFSRLYILRNIYSEVLDIKETYPFLIKVNKNQYNLY